MHPRNIYKKVDFKTLAASDSNFRRHVKLIVQGRVEIDFKDPETLRALAKALLKRDFGIEIEIPINTLVPTIPLRLNYILFIEDLLTCAKINNDVIGIDIGTGGSCIYPLIAVRKNNWKMVASDCDSVNIKYAKENVIKNRLEESIRVIEVSGETTISEILNRDATLYTFCMCNPPFFSGVSDLSSQLKSRKPTRKKPNNVFCASVHEVVTEGGEVEFVSKIITESHEHKHRIKIFTSMLGIKKSLIAILPKLKKSPEIKSYATCEFIQGHTTRWGIAWTFYSDFNISHACDYYTPKIKKPIKKPLSYSQTYSKSIEELGIEIEHILDGLQIEYKILKRENNERYYSIVAHFNTWAKSRQKRREAKRMETLMGTLNSGNEDMTIESNNYVETTMDTSLENTKETSDNHKFKRKLSESEEEERMESEETGEFKKIHISNVKDVNLLKLVEASLYVRVESDELNIEMDSTSETTNREMVHQILQYIKNVLNK